MNPIGVLPLVLALAASAPQPDAGAGVPTAKEQALMEHTCRLVQAGPSHDALTHWRERWNRLRGLEAPARRGVVVAALRRRVYRGCDALRTAWYRWRNRPLPHGVRYRELERIHLHADDTYRPRPYAGEITLFRAREQPERLRDSWALGWEALALGGVRVVDLPGTHDTLIEQPDLARALRAALDAVRGGARAGLDAPQRRTG